MKKKHGLFFGFAILAALALTFALAFSGCDNPAGGGGDPTYIGVTVTPPETKGTIETVGTPATTFVKAGESVTLSAAVQGTNGPSQNVTWSITSTGHETGTAIDPSTGALTIATAEPHGATITVKAVAATDTSVSGTADIIAVAVMPSDFYGEWVATDKCKAAISAAEYNEAQLTTGNAPGENSFAMSISAMTALKYSDRNLSSGQPSTMTASTHPYGFTITGTVTAHTGTGWISIPATGSSFTLEFLLAASGENIYVESWTSFFDK